MSWRQTASIPGPGGRQALYLSLIKMAEQESENNAARVRATYPAMLRRKGFKPGGRRKYGRNADGTIREREASVVRSIVQWVIAGMSGVTIARRLNARGSHPHRVGAGTPAPSRSYPSPRSPALYQVDGEVIDRAWNRSSTARRGISCGPCSPLEDHARAPRPRAPSVPFLLDDPIRVRCGSCGGRMGVRFGAERVDGTVQAAYLCVARERRRSRARLPNEAGASREGGRGDACDLHARSDR